MKFRDRLSLRLHQVTDPSTSEDLTLKREIHLARNIQTTLLNGEKPKLRNGEVTGSSIPARLIGGDYYDFYPLSNGKIRIVIGDVMGKGIPAAMLMILTRGAFRSAAESTISPGETLTAMNNALYKDLRSLRSFVTVFCADWDPCTFLLTYANAGHHLPLFIREDTVKPLPKVSGVMLGGLPNQTYEEMTIQMKSNDYIYFYTDGIVESENIEGEQFTLERLIAVLQKHEGRSVHEIQQMTIEAIQQFTKGTQQKDDITMVILKAGENAADITGIHSPMNQE
jgi:phosphoserine phosphatase RsbU/P